MKDQKHYFGLFLIDHYKHSCVLSKANYDIFYYISFFTRSAFCNYNI